MQTLAARLFHFLRPWRRQQPHLIGAPPPVCLLPPDGLTKSQARALPIPDTIPPALADSLAAILQRLALEQASTSDLTSAPDSHTLIHNPLYGV